MSVTLYINFNGNCREAVDYYKTVFNTEKPTMMLFGELPSYEGAVVAPELKDLVLNATLRVHGTMLMFSDVPPDRPVTVGDNTSIVVSFQNIDEQRSVFGMLKVGGTINMELQETFWTKCYGYLTDKYGISWMLTLENPQQ